MVSQFREFLHTSPRFEELRESLPYRAGGSRLRGVAARRSQAMVNNLPSTEGEAFDDEMADEENDFEGLDGSEMAVDAQVYDQLPTAGTASTNHGPTVPQGGHAIPVPPPAPSLSQHPFASPSHAQSVAQQYMYPPTGAMGPLAFSSFMSNEPASGAPPLSAHGHAQASMASLTPASGPSQQASTANGGQLYGASTAPMQPPYQDSLGE